MVFANVAAREWILLKKVSEAFHATSDHFFIACQLYRTHFSHLAGIIALLRTACA